MRMRVIRKTGTVYDTRLHVNISSHPKDTPVAKHQLNAIKIIISIKVLNFDILSMVFFSPSSSRRFGYHHFLWLLRCCDSIAHLWLACSNNFSLNVARNSIAIKTISKNTHISNGKLRFDQVAIYDGHSWWITPNLDFSSLLILYFATSLCDSVTALQRDAEEQVENEFGKINKSGKSFEPFSVVRSVFLNTFPLCIILRVVKIRDKYAASNNIISHIHSRSLSSSLSCDIMAIWFIHKICARLCGFTWT